MSEQTKPVWRVAPVYVNMPMPDGTVLRYVLECHVPDVDEVCGEDALAVDVVPAVTSAEVRATLLFQTLDTACHIGFVPAAGTAADAYRTYLIRCDLLKNNGGVTDQGRTILAALQQPWRAAAEWLAGQLVSVISDLDWGEPPTAEGWLSAALSTVGAAPVPDAAPTGKGEVEDSEDAERERAQWQALVEAAARSKTLREWVPGDAVPADAAGYLDWLLGVMKMADDLTVEFSQEDIGKLRDHILRDAAPTGEPSADELLAALESRAQPLFSSSGMGDDRTEGFTVLVPGTSDPRSAARAILAGEQEANYAQ